MTFWKWSRTASSNATADGSINWAEGMAPSAVNDSARAVMAAAAKYRDDVAGAILTGGISTAYTVASYQGFDTLAHLDGQMIAFTPHATSGATVTLNVDGLGAKPLRASPGMELPSGTLVLGTPYVALYSNTDGAFYLHGFAGNPYSIPLGGLLPYTGATAPNSAFVLPYGQAISRTAYASYFSLVGTAFGSGDGSTTFNIPDLRGRAIFGQDNMGGSAASRITTAGSSVDGTTIGANGGAQSVSIAQANIPNYTLPDTIGGSIAFNGAAYVTDGIWPVNQTSATLNNMQRAGNVTSLTATFSKTGSVTSGGSGTALNNMPPAIVLPMILRVI